MSRRRATARGHSVMSPEERLRLAAGVSLPLKDITSCKRPQRCHFGKKKQKQKRMNKTIQPKKNEFFIKVVFHHSGAFLCAKGQEPLKRVLRRLNNESPSEIRVCLL